MLKSLADNSDQKSDIETHTDSDSDYTESTSQIQQPVSHLTSPLSSLPSSFLWPRLPTLSQLPQCFQTKLDCQNRRIAKATSKHQESYICEQQEADRGDKQNSRRSQKTKDSSTYLTRIQTFFCKNVYNLTTWEDGMTCPDSQLWQQAWS